MSFAANVSFDRCACRLFFFLQCVAQSRVKTCSCSTPRYVLCVWNRAKCSWINPSCWNSKLHSRSVVRDSSVVVKTLGTGSCNFSTENCEFPTEEIIRRCSGFQFVLKCPKVNRYKVKCIWGKLEHTHVIICTSHLVWYVPVVPSLLCRPTYYAATIFTPWLPPPRRLCFCQTLSVCLSVREQDNLKSYGRIFLKFWGNVGHGINYKWFNFGRDPAGILDSGSLW